MELLSRLSLYTLHILIHLPLNKTKPTRSRRLKVDAFDIFMERKCHEFRPDRRFLGKQKLVELVTNTSLFPLHFFIHQLLNRAKSHRSTTTHGRRLKYLDGTRMPRISAGSSISRKAKIDRANLTGVLLSRTDHPSLLASCFLTLTCWSMMFLFSLHNLIYQPLNRAKSSPFTSTQNRRFNYLEGTKMPQTSARHI